MRTIPAAEIKRRGISAALGPAAAGPVHVLQNNRPVCVVLSVAAYERLAVRATLPEDTAEVWTLLLAEPDPPGGGADRAALDAALRAEREAWDAPG